MLWKESLSSDGHQFHQYQQYEQHMYTILDFPEIHSISPSIADSSEDFPDPTRPTIATNDPSGMFISMLKYNQT
jgi:hypothetical protein